MTTELRTLSTSDLEAELRRRKDNEKMLCDIAQALSILDDAWLVVRLEAGNAANSQASYGKTSYDMRKLLTDAMRTALLARKTELEATP